MARSNPRLRIAIGRIAQESNCFSRLATTISDFRATHYLEGKALLEVCNPFGNELPGYLRNGELTGAVDALRADGNVEIIPLLSAWTIPAGPLTRDCFDTLLGRLTEDLARAGKVDGVVLSLHGAMGVEGVADADTVVLRAVKAVANAPVTVTHDLHAALTEERVRTADLLVGYRTNPHRDHRRSGREAAQGLLAILREGARPETAWRSLPMILGGGNTVDFLQPMRGIFRRLGSIVRDPWTMTASIMMCHPWNDEPRLGFSSLVSTRGDRAQAESWADELAELLWSVRKEMPPTFSSPEQAIQEARAATLARKLGVVVLSDASDVVSAGAAGENTRLLRALYEQARDLVSLVPIRDAAVSEALWKVAEGEFAAVTLGGKIDPREPSFSCEGKVIAKRMHPALGRMVVLDLGHVKVVITQGHSLAVKPSFYSELGLSVWKPDIVVVKNFFPFRMFFAPMARKVIYVRTEGSTDLDAAFKLTFDGPVTPRDEVSDWRARDQARRAVPG